MTKESTLALADRLETECIVRDNHPDDYCRDLTKMFRECVAALRDADLPLVPPSSTAQEPVARRQAIAQCIETIRPWTVGAFTGWQGKTGDFKITLDEAEDHFSLCMMDMMEDVRALLYVAPLETPSRDGLRNILLSHLGLVSNVDGNSDEWCCLISGIDTAVDAILAALPPPADTGQREDIAAVIYVTRFPHRTWFMASLEETAIAYKQADAILSLVPRKDVAPADTGQLRTALELAIDVFGHVQETYKCPESPLINLTVEKCRHALAALPLPADTKGTER